jgi:hypothetical protein
MSTADTAITAAGDPAADPGPDGAAQADTVGASEQGPGQLAMFDRDLNPRADAMPTGGVRR